MGDEVLHCGNCAQPMQRLVLDGHYGQRVEIDLCAPCHLLWFDAIESARLAGTGMLALLGTMAGAQTAAHHALRRDARCARCAGALKTVHNRSRWGKTQQLECVRRHGAYQTFAQYLGEKGLVRPLSPADRASLSRRDGGLACLNCGAAILQSDERCSYCDTLPGMVDVARLAAALDPEGATDSHAVHRVAARHASLHCLACGAPLAEGAAAQCGQCGATLGVGHLGQAHAAVGTLAHALRSHAESPAPHVRERRLARLDGDLARRREWVRDMEAHTDASASPSDDGRWLDDVRERPWTVAAVAAALLAMWLWWR